MSSIPMVMTIGHDLNDLLLCEADAALHDGDWDYALHRLRQFRHRAIHGMRAEEELLYPHYLRSLGRGSRMLRRLAREHARIEALTGEALQAAEAASAFRSQRALAELMDLVTRHWAQERPMMCYLPQTTDDNLLKQLSNALSRHACPVESLPIAARPTRARLVH